MTIPYFSPTLADLQLINITLQEDLGQPYCDATTDLLFPESNISQAHIISKHPSSSVLCGSQLIPLIAKEFGCTMDVIAHYQDGDFIPQGATILTLQAKANHLLILERTILNFLRHLSGVAMLTSTFVEKVKHTHCQLLDTRKTTPGFRHLEKYAVQCGGGLNHRQGLYDAIMIKDTHVDLLGGMRLALERLPLEKKLPVIIEVRDAAELDIALSFKNRIDRILLDNIRGSALKAAVQQCHAKGVLTEASGNLTLDTIVEVAESGIDFASVGALTHSATQIDLSMKINFHDT
jgi:nicotinate-nucleotide pyrophosphorylase (carboxylating)